MKALFAISLLALAGSAAAAPDSSGPGNVCITGYQIDHTTVISDQTILFAMRDHTVYRNRLPNRCFGLKAETAGFSYEPTDPGSDELCSNLMTIHLNSLHSTCQIGAFEQMPKGTKG